MMVVLCPTCHLVVRVLGEPAQVHPLVGTGSEFWPNKYDCPRCGQRAEGRLEREVPGALLGQAEVRDLTPEEAYAAFLGVGMPEEQACSLADVQALLVQVPICRVVGHDVPGQARTVLDRLELTDGTQVYFGASGDGAVIYRIRRRSHYAARLLAKPLP